MSEELQGLLNRIQSDGLKKAEAQRDEILAAAREEAAKIVAAAKEEAAQIRMDAEKDADISRTKAEAAIRQAVRDVLISLKADLQQNLRNVVCSTVGAAMTPAEMAALINRLADTFRANAVSGAEIEIPVREKAIADQLLASLQASLRAKAQIHLGRGFASGFKLGFTDSDVFLDFSDEALADVICDYVGPKLAAIIKA